MHYPNLIELDLRGSVVPPASRVSDTDNCRPACPELARRTHQLEQYRVEDLASVVAALHEALGALGAEMSSWQGDVQTSAEKFGALVAQPDPAVLRTKVLDEVRALKQVVVERRERWEDTQRTYAERVTALELQLRTTRAEASTDGLTGVANRRAFDREMAHRLRSSQERVVLALFDVDDFKDVNDTLGHAEGDRLLADVAAMLATSTRPGDLVARLGGDEFAVIVAGLTLGQAECRFSTLVSEISVALHGVSCGLSEFSAGDNVQSLYDRADTALYEAKRDGKQRVVSKSQRYLRDR